MKQKIETLIKKEGRSKTFVAMQMGISPSGLDMLLKKPLDDWKWKYIKVLQKYNLLPTEV